MIKKKVCMVGAFAVGKTSLVRRYVEGFFDDKYLTTIGVKISKKVVEVENVDVELILWDIEGEDEFTKVRASYLKGAAMLILVIDGTRQESLEIAINIKNTANNVAKQPYQCVVLLNKSDLQGEWEVNQQAIEGVETAGIPVFKTSAKNDTGVEAAFKAIGQMIFEQNV